MNNPPKAIICFDLATLTGLAVWVNGEVISTTKSLKARTNGEKYSRLSHLFQELIESDALKGIPLRDIHVYCERPFARGAGTMFLFGLVAIIEHCCFTHGCQFVKVVPPQSVKAFVAKGGCGKDDVIRAVQRLFPDQMIIDDNQADALALLAYARKQ